MGYSHRESFNRRPSASGILVIAPAPLVTSERIAFHRILKIGVPMLTLSRGVRVEIKPVTTAVMAAARAATTRKVGTMRVAELDLVSNM